MQNIDLSSLNTKKRFTINGDEDKVLEIDTADLGVIERVNDFYDLVGKVFDELSKLNYSEAEDNTLELIESLQKVDAEMRNGLDRLFDANVCEVCYPKGYLFNVRNGNFVFQTIIEAISKLYEKDLQAEFKKLEHNVKKRTEKYVKR